MCDKGVTTMEIALAERALELAMKISTETTTDAWFNYSGHVNCFTAEYTPDEDSKLIGIAICEKVSVKTLQYIIDCFEFIYAVAEKRHA